MTTKIPEHIVVAIDGHSSGGKSTFAKAIARELGLTYIDSGAMYRAVTLFCLRNHLVKNDEINNGELEKRLDEINIEFKYNKELCRHETYLNGENIEDEIREIEVSKFVSPVSKIRSVREKMVALQREMSKNRGVVMDGRDIGTVVFPDADLKIFLTASIEKRAERRFRELREKGSNITYGEVLDNITDRDHQDSTRDISPLTKADDAISLDNSEMTVDEQMEWFRKIITQRFDD